MAGITATGLEIKTASEIQSEIEADYIAAFGSDIDLDPDSPTGQDVGIQTERFSLIWELVQQLYNESWSSSATGINLDRVFALIGKSRLPAIKSTVTLTLGNTGGLPVTVPAGSLVSQSTTGAQWETLQEVEIPAASTIDVEAQAVNFGPISASIGSINTIDTPISGWDSVTNAAEATEGRNEETDPEFRLRVAESTSIAQAGTLQAVINNVLTVSGVTFCGGSENRTKFINAEGLPPHSFNIVCLGGADQDIRQAIYEAGPAGIEAFGDINGTVNDSLGNPVNIGFSRPSEIDIYLIVNLTTNANYPVNGDDLVKAALVAYGATLSNGDNVINYKLVCEIADIAGIETIEILQGIAPAPTLENNIIIAIDEIANIDTVNITVNS